MGKKIKVENSLSMVMGKASRLLTNRISKNLSEYNVTAEQWMLLASLWRKNGQTQQSLAEVSNKNKASITHLIDNLEKRALVRRHADEGDRRNKIIYLTPEGERLQEELAGIVKKTTKDMTRGIDKKDLRVSKHVMKQIVENLLND